jgi:hypothetical protein
VISNSLQSGGEPAADPRTPPIRDYPQEFSQFTGQCGDEAGPLVDASPPADVSWPGRILLLARMRLPHSPFAREFMKHPVLFPWTTFAGTAVCLLLLISIVGSNGCVSKNSRQGVENRWRAETAPVFKQGETTEHDVLAALGPPSQLINLGNKTVFYYLQEQKQTRSLILVLYNQTREKITYDRAIFFFDHQGRLSEFATSDEKNPIK